MADFTDKYASNIMEQPNSGTEGASLNDFQAIEQAVDGLQSRIRKMDETIKQQNETIERLEQDKTRLEQTFESYKSEARADVSTEIKEEAEAQYFHELGVLEQANIELDAENDFIASERDALQSKVIELEGVCEAQKIIIDGLRANTPPEPIHTVFRSALDSIKAKLGL